MAFNIFIYILAGLGAGVGRLAGLSAAAVISHAHHTFLGFPPEAVGISLASDVLASASAHLRQKQNLDIKNGLIMLCSVLVFTMVGSWAASLVPNSTMGGFLCCDDAAAGRCKFIARPVMTPRGQHGQKPPHKSRAVRAVRRSSALSAASSALAAV